MTPAMTATFPPRISSHLIPAPAVRKSGRILVVDDEPPMCRFIEAGLRAAGYADIIFSSNGSHVLALALTECPQLIIMDVMMPGGNGMRALRTLKTTPATRGIPVIITSGFHVPDADECVQNRADHVLSKPFTAGQLLTAVGQLIAN